LAFCPQLVTRNQEYQGMQFIDATQIETILMKLSILYALLHKRKYHPRCHSSCLMWPNEKSTNGITDNMPLTTQMVTYPEPNIFIILHFSRN
jgi:hypothetical protein